MVQTKLRGSRPFSSPTADDDVQGLYDYSYWCEFPTHLHRTLRLTSAWHSGPGSDFGLLAWPGLKMTSNVYMFDGRIIRWSTVGDGVADIFKMVRVCDLADNTWRYIFQHFTNGNIDGAWEFSRVPVATHPEKCNHSVWRVAQIFVVPSDPFGDWAMQIEWWGVLPGHDYPPPGSDPLWEHFH